MNAEILVERLFQQLINGNRQGARAIIQEVRDGGWSAERCAFELYWPILNLLHQLYRADQISTISHHFATRLLRCLSDQTQIDFECKPENGRRVLIACGDTVIDEISASLAADLIEAGGFEVHFAGGGVASDEILAQVGETRPDCLLLFSSAASDLPGIRQMIDHLREVNAVPELQIVVGGGVYARAEGLAEEIGADLYIPDIPDLVRLLTTESQRRATKDQRTVGRKRRSRSAA